MNKKGSILMIGLWILTILVIFAVGLGHRASVTLKLARYQKDRLKAAFLARGGVNQAVVILLKDEVDPRTADFDTPSECGVGFKDNQVPESVFSAFWADKKENYKIGYLDPAGEFTYGMRDEERRIDINQAASLQNRAIVTELFRPYDAANCAELANTVVDWIDPDSDTAGGGKEDPLFKNDKLAAPEELLVILEYFYEKSGDKEPAVSARKLYEKIKDFFTVEGSASINVNTVSLAVLQMFVNSAADESQRPCAENAAEEIIKLRDEKTRSGQTLKSADEMKIEDTAIDPASPCAGLFDNLKTKFIFKSDKFRIESTGEANGITKAVTAVYSRADRKFVYWHEN